MINTRNQIRTIRSETSGLRVISGNPVGGLNRTSAVAVNRTPEKSSRKKETAFYDIGSSLGGMNITALGQNPAFYDTLLTGLASELEPTNHRFYKDIYHYDTTAGACIDLMSTMPFSDFELAGVEPNRLDVYEKSIEQLNLKTFFPEMTVDYLVFGEHISSLMFDSKSKTFTDIISHPPSNCEMIPVPLRSRDPFIKVKQSDDIRAFMTSNDPRVVALRKKMNTQIVGGLSAEEAELDPTSTLYMARKTVTYSSRGTSLYKRLLPIYFLEKTLYKGTVVEAGRRQRSLLHLAIGDDTWEPTVEELTSIVALFQQADLDPLGAIIATRAGVNPNELRQGGDFWKWTDIIDILGPAKLRALGISESFLSGDATYNNMETGLSVFVENLQAYRERCTFTILYNKILPLIAAVNDFKVKNQKGDKGFTETSNTGMIGNHILKSLNNTSQWDIPEVKWKKNLGLDINTQMFEILDKLKDLGAPIGIRAYAAAGGLDLNTLQDDWLEEQKLKAIWDKMPGFKPEKEGFGEEGGDEQGSDEEESPAEFSRYIPGLGRRRRSILSRDFGELGEIKGTTKTGKPKYLPNQRVEQAKANQAIVNGMKAIQDPNRLQENLKRVREMNGGKIPTSY